MHDLTRQMGAFREELLKTAAPAVLEATKKVLKSQAAQRALGGLGAGSGVGAGAGALLGGALGAGRSYEEARQQGAGGLLATLSGVGGGLGGAAKGGILGAGVGGLGLGALQAAGKAKGLSGQLAGAEGPIGSLARAGQRSVHGLTGWTPKGYFSPSGARQIRAGAYDAIEGLDKAKAGLKGAKDKVKATKELERAKAHVEAAEKAERMGLTSVPGYLRSMKNNGVGKTISTGMKEQWEAGGPVHKAMLVGFPALGLAEAARPSEPGEPGRLERLGRNVGAGLGFGLGPMPLAGQMAASGLMGASGGLTGKLLDKAVGKKKQKKLELGTVPEPPAPDPADGGTTPSEYIYSDRALGMIPEGLVTG